MPLPITGSFVKGRYLAVLLMALVAFWNRHKTTLGEELTPEMVAAIDALAALAPFIVNLINPPGPG